MGGEYCISECLGSTKDACEYWALDPLEDKHRISELSLQASSDNVMLLERLSRLNHPCLSGIVQKFTQDDRLCFSTFALNARALDKLWASNQTHYQSHEVISIAQNLIDLLGYFHSFGIFGVKMAPNAIEITSQAQPYLLLRKFIDGSIPFDLRGEADALDDCQQLAITLHALITGKQSNKHWHSLVGRFDDYPASLLAGIDAVLQPNTAKPKSAIEWRLACASPAPQSHLKKLWLVGGITAVLIIGTGVYLLLASNSSTEPDAGASEQIVIPAPILPPTPSVDWSFDLPFAIQDVSTDAEPAKFVMTQRSDIAALKKTNPWFVDGEILRAINGQNLDETATLHENISNALTQSTKPDITLTVHDAILPLERQVALSLVPKGRVRLGETTFEQRQVGSNWVLNVVETNDANSRLLPNDRLLNSGGNPLLVAGIFAFHQHIHSLKQNGQTTFNLTVLQANGGTRAITVPVSAFYVD